MGEDRFVIRKTDFVPQKEMLLRDRIFEGDPDAPEVADLLRRCRGQAEPAAVVKLVEVTHDGEGRVTAVGGESMSGPVLDRQLKDIHRAFAFIATSGRSLAEVDTHGDRDLGRALLAVGIAAVREVVRQAEAELRERYHLGKLGELNPGSLPEWPIAEQDKLFRILGDVKGEIGVTLGENHFLTPLASSSGLLFETEQDYQNCAYCTNFGCAIRRALYDPETAAELETMLRVLRDRGEDAAFAYVRRKLKWDALFGGRKKP